MKADSEKFEVFVAGVTPGCRKSENRFFFCPFRPSESRSLPARFVTLSGLFIAHMNRTGSTGNAPARSGKHGRMGEPAASKSRVSDKLRAPGRYSVRSAMGKVYQQAREKAYCGSLYADMRCS